MKSLTVELASEEMASEMAGALTVRINDLRKAMRETPSEELSDLIKHLEKVRDDIKTIWMGW